MKKSELKLIIKECLKEELSRSVKKYPPGIYKLKLKNKLTPSITIKNYNTEDVLKNKFVKSGLVNYYESRQSIVVDERGTPVKSKLVREPYPNIRLAPPHSGYYNDIDGSESIYRGHD